MTPIAVLTVLGSALVGAGPTPHSQATVLASVSRAVPGQPFLVGFHIQMDPGWHCYWKNPGDSGEATDVKWEVPKGWKIEPLAWPIPETIDAGGFISYGYEKETTLLYRFTPPATAKGEVALKADAQWLICQEACLPAQTTVGLKIPFGKAAAPSAQAGKLMKVVSQLPVEVKNWKIRAQRQGKFIDLVLDAPSGVTVEDGTQFFAADPETIAHSEKQTLDGRKSYYVLRMTQSEYASKPPMRLRGILVAPEGKTWPSGRAIEIDVPIKP